MSIFQELQNKNIKNLNKLALEIIDKNKVYKDKSREELIKKVADIKDLIIQNESVDKFLVEIFAIVMEAIERTLNKKLYNVQLIGGIALHQGRIIEMKTGEGKTLTEICPAILNSLNGRGTHIITVNDYLATRDFYDMKVVYEYLDISVGLIISDSDNFERKLGYECDVTYTTNTELGFDYLRDNIAKTKELQVQRDLYYVIIDEIDSILIDEARTPLILAKDSKIDDIKLKLIRKVIEKIPVNMIDVNIKENYVILKENGIAMVEKIIGLDNLSDPKNSEIRHLLIQGLRAEYLFEKDKDYIIKNEEIILIDNNTGRLAQGRKLSDALHQSIEAKEKIEITNDTITNASITYQNFFKLYNKLSGMSGTVATEEAEFKNFYNLDIVNIPTNKPIMRIDRPDIVCNDKEERNNLLLKEIKNLNDIGRPILIATSNVEESENISNFLNDKNIKHMLLNAKTNDEEAKIISKAGEKEAITVATNIAGRGTDIKLNDDVNSIGGLKVIGIERSFSKRIDNQLIGRAGRQGNNGSSQFYISAEDTLFKEFTEKHMRDKLKKISGNKKKKYILNTIYKAQKMIEVRGFEERKDVIKYDEVLNRHRKIIYLEREKILNDSLFNIGEQLAEYIFQEVTSIVNNQKDVNKIIDYINKEFNIRINIDNIDFSFNEIIDILSIKIVEVYNTFASQIKDDLNEINKNILLDIIDFEWIVHMETMNNLKRSMKAESYSQKDPFQMYELNAAKEFNSLIIRIRKKFLRKIFSNIIKK
ncbi:MAG: helicase-related protein [Sarcina sp.]